MKVDDATRDAIKGFIALQGQCRRRRKPLPSDAAIAAQMGIDASMLDQIIYTLRRAKVIRVRRGITGKLLYRMAD